MPSPDDPLIPTHGGYRNLKTFKIAQLIHDITARFCALYINRHSRTRDQMEQAARSGVQNIAEGSQASGTSKKSELKLTNVARASLEELRLDYEDFLRQRNLRQWPADDAALSRFKSRRCATLEDLRAWVDAERKLAGTRTNTDEHGPARTDTDKNTNDHSAEILSSSTPSAQPTAQPFPSVPVRVSPCSSVPVRAPHTSELIANAALSLLNLCNYLLDRQLAAQSKTFEQEGGFTERLYHKRKNQQFL